MTPPLPILTPGRYSTVGPTRKVDLAGAANPI